MASAELEDLVRESRFIFRGTVERLGAATLSAAPVSDRTVVVKVDEVIHAPKIFEDLTGKDITVELAEPGTLKEKQQAVFFTNPWLYGDGIAVHEVGRQDVSPGQGATEGERIRREVSTFTQKQPDDELRQHLAVVDAVVVGIVLNTRPIASSANRPTPEHDPDWWEATVSVESVEKGNVAGKTVAVAFANSMDVAWFEAPKLRVGQEGIWLLHLREKMLGDPEAPAPPPASPFVVIHALDAHQKNAMDRLRKLLKGS